MTVRRQVFERKPISGAAVSSTSPHTLASLRSEPAHPVPDGERDAHARVPARANRTRRYHSRSRLCHLALLLALALTPPGYAVADAPQPRIAILDYEAPVSNDWIAETPTSSMRLHQYRLPGESEDLAAQLVVYFFGITQGGSVDANIGRWRSQFSTPEGESVEPTIRRFQVRNLPVTTAEFRGDYRRGIGMGPGGEPLKDHILVAAIVETPQGNLFVQLYGPAQTVSRHRAAFADFLNNIEPATN